MGALPNNYVHLHGYVKKIFLNDKVGTIRISVENEFKGKTYETFLNVLCFGNVLESARNLKENQYVTVHGRLSRKEKNGQWCEEVVGVKLLPSEKFNEKAEAYNKSFKEAFGDSWD